MKTIENSPELGLNLADGAAEEIHKVEELVRKRICINSEIHIQRLFQDFDSTGRVNRAALERAIHNMVRNGELEQRRNGKMIQRVR